MAWDDIFYHKDAWSDNAAFYGQILPFSDVDNSQPIELKGMSGGPIFSFYRETGFLNIELEGIFDSYHKRDRQIRAEPTDRMLANIEKWINELD